MGVHLSMSDKIIEEAHVGPVGGNFHADTTTRKVLQFGLLWSSLNKDCNAYVNKCDKCQQMGQPLR